jgi:UDP-3-O-[3-hydroxymyristoyl] glucosamine N-acyltransferase
MIIGNKKPLFIIGYASSSMTAEFAQAINQIDSCKVIAPLDFYSMPEKINYQYIVSVSKDLHERLEIINFLEKENLDVFTVIHKTCVMDGKPKPTIGLGSFIFPYTIIGFGANIGKHCIISSQSMIGHFTSLGDNCILRPGVMIVDKSTVGKNCVFNLRSSVRRGKITDAVEIGEHSQVRKKNITISGKYAGYPLKKLVNYKRDDSC